MADIKYQVDVDARGGIRNLKELQNQVNQTSQGFGTFKKVIVAAAAALGAGAFASSIKNAMDSVDGLAKSARALGVSAANFQALARSASLAGIGLGELQMTAQRLQSTLINAVQRGTGPAAQGLDRLGLSARDLANQPIDQQLQAITSALRNIENPAERAALSIELLGKQGPRMLEVADNMQRLKDEMERAGLALTSFDTTAIETANDAVSELQFLFESLRQKIASEVAPFLIAITRYIRDSVLEGRNLGAVIRENIVPAIKIATQAVATFAGFWLGGKIAAAIAVIVTGIAAMVKAIAVAGTAMAVFNQITEKNKLIAILGAVLGLLGAFGAYKAVTGIFDDIEKNVQSIVDELKAQVEAQKDIGASTESTNTLISEQQRLTENITANLRRQARGYQEIANQQAQTIRRKIEDIGLDEDQIRLKETLRQAESAYLTESKRLQDELFRLKQSNDEKDKAQIQVILQLLAELDKKYQTNLETNKKLTEELNYRLHLHREELAINKQIEESIKRREAVDTAVRNAMLDGIDRVKKARESAELDSLFGVQRQLREIEIEERRLAEAAKRRVAEQFGDNDPEGLMRAFEEIERAFEFTVARRKEAIQAIVEEQRTFADGWKKAFGEYKDNATNAANQARRIFATATRSMEDAIVNFAKTGKFEFRNFVNIILEELLRIQIQRTFANIFGNSRGGGGSGSLFGGFFATGGMIPPGRFGVVGERGPELVEGPANVTPLTGTQVTYNINAVDASSFKEMLARDPSFLFAVTEQGRRRAPGTRR